MITYRVINVCHLQEIFGTAVLLHLNSLSAPLHRHTITLRKLCVGRHLKVSTFENDFVDVIFVLSEDAVSKNIFNKKIFISKIRRKAAYLFKILLAAGDYKCNDDNQQKSSSSRRDHHSYQLIDY